MPCSGRRWRWPYWAWRLGSAPTALIAANTWGSERSLTFSGRSAILQKVGGARWWVLAATEVEGDGIIRATLRDDSPAVDAIAGR